MADFSSFTSKFRAVRTNGQNGASESLGKVMKRPRLVCNQCQRSKVRCDRGQPCSNCVKRNESDKCSYQVPTRSNSSRSSLAEDKLLHLESMVKRLIQNQLFVDSENDATPFNFDRHAETPIIQVDPVDESPRSELAENSKYVGSTHWSAMLEDIYEPKVVLAGSLEQQGVGDIFMPDPKSSSCEVIFGSSTDYSLQRIIAQFLPPKIEVDRYLSKYFQAETYILPFIHTYHFQRQYQEFWADTEGVNPLWLSILFSICHLALLIGRTTSSSYSPNEISATRNSGFHTAAGQCLILGEYHRPEQFAVEALALYGQCKNLKTLDPSREVVPILGMLVRMSYEMGYHRDPDSVGSFTVFEGEMRRRFWSSIKQMDLMISFQLGLPSNINLEHCDTKSPRNLLDSDFDESTQVLPASRSEAEGTKLLWFIVKERQMIGFSKVCQNVLSFKEKSEAEIIQLDREIRERHTTVPDVLRARPLSESIADPPFLIMTRLYIDFIHLKSLCVLHRKYMARGNTFSTRTCVQAGMKLVGQFIEMHNEFSPGGQLYNEHWMLTNFTVNDFMLGIMVLCLVIHTRWKRGADNSPVDAATESRVLTILEQSHSICTEISVASKDARRVSHAIRLTLAGASSATGPKHNGSQFPSRTVASSDIRPAPGGFQAVDPLSMNMSPWNGYALSDEAAFGTLDPFNFMGNEFENFDWTAFDSDI